MFICKKCFPHTTNHSCIKQQMYVATVKHVCKVGTVDMMHVYSY